MFYGNLSLQFHEAIVRNQLWKQMAQMFQYMLHIEMLQATVARTMKQNQDNNHFCLGKPPVTMVCPLFSLSFRVYFSIIASKNQQKIIRHTENFRNFVLGKH